MEERSSVLAQCLRVLAVVLFMGLCVNGVWLPSPKGDETPLTEVAESRARKHLEVIARAPHPTGSEEAKRVREYLRSELESLGIETEFISGTIEVGGGLGDTTDEGGPEEVEVVNVLARIPGRQPFHEGRDRDVILFACHYDSVDRGEEWRGPGAGDDGAAVASMLETARALTAGKPLLNDVWFLFTDGEELGLLGAKVFCSETELVEQVDLVFNFEGIGNNGPSVMFQTSENASRLLGEFAELECAKVAPSFSQAIYERLPNDTDFTVFTEYGLGGLNFAIVGGRSAYHRPWDTVENLTPETLQYQLDTVHALALHFGELHRPSPFSRAPRPYLDMWGVWVPFVGPGLGVLLLVFSCMRLAREFPPGHKSRGWVFFAVWRILVFQAFLAPVLLVLLLGLPALLGWLAQILGVEPVQRGDSLSSFLLAWGSLSVGLAVLASWGQMRGRRREEWAQLFLGSRIVWIALGALLCWLLPMAIPYVLFPAYLMIFLGWDRKSRDTGERPKASYVVFSLAVLALLAPSLGLIVALMSHAPFVVAIVCAIVICLAGPLGTPLVHWMRIQGRAPLYFTWALALLLLASSGVLRATGL